MSMGESLGEVVRRLKAVADICYQHQHSREDEADLAVLKKCPVVVDGYEIELVYSRDHQQFPGGGFDLLTLQVHSKYVPFLPFRLVADLAVRFLGDDGLSLSEFHLLGRKVYIWSRAASPTTGRPIHVPLHRQVQACRYGGLEFSKAPPTVLSVG